MRRERLTPPQGSHSPGNNREKNRDHRDCNQMRQHDTRFDSQTSERLERAHYIIMKIRTIDVVLPQAQKVETRMSYAAIGNWEIAASI